MGYESRIYVIDVHREKKKGHKDYGKVRYAEKIVTFNLSCMGYTNGWKNLFNKPIDYKIYADNGDETFDTDRYGERLKSADLGEVIHWLETRGNDQHYRRIAPVLGMLKGFDISEWDELQIVHYGY